MIKKKLSIIGANGFIARNFIKYIGNKFELKLYDIHDYSYDSYDTYKKINILDSESLSSDIFDSDFIYLFSGKTGTIDGFENYTDFIYINEIGVLNILKKMKKFSSKATLIFPSTRLVYKGSESELVEESEKEFKTIYSMNKFSCERYIEMFNKMYGIKYLIFRICVPYGSLLSNISSYGTLGFMEKNAKENGEIKIYGDGKQRRTFTYIGDICSIFSKITETNMECSIYNIGGENLSLLEVAQFVQKNNKCEITFVDWPANVLKIESGSTVLNSDKLDNILNFNYKKIEYL